MAHDPDAIWKALRLVPEFDGNPHILTRFIRICDKLVNAYVREGPEHELNNLSLISGILNKITGPAARTVNSNGIPESWNGIRSVLINNFADRRDETTLYNDLSLQTQGNDTPQELYDRCQTLFSTIMTYITLHETVPTTINAKRDLYKKLTMQAFVRGLKEPLGSRIRCMRPDSIETALQFVQEELNVLYLQQRNDSLPKLTNTHPKSVTQLNPSPMHAGFPALRNTNAMPLPKPVTPAYAQPRMMQWPQPTQFRFNAGFNAPYNQPRMPSHTQRTFGAPPPNHNPHDNAFRMAPRPPPQNLGPKAMSGVSNFVAKPLPPTRNNWDWSKQGNPPPMNYFKTRDVNVNECLSYEDFYYPEYYVYEQEPNYYENNYPMDYYGNYSCVYDSVPQTQTEVTTDMTNDGNAQVDEQPQPSTSREDFQGVTKSKKSK